ncbi:DUF3667 domain-containing protein [Flavobacterium sinopsychrotolerans]|uniref:DUF3667 domain-containing protein n=1 Tax=Flavobacterium sinopsychrotolerans TaxID=604089 RepID=A0A1H8KIU6_9FLAO|nr:DUF3667 domain-containing protein [Flavobacterium sinopsychrotolerans]SEN92883.1 Protein of unknown function [Flavobacterium sinopsychrotolerans]
MSKSKIRNDKTCLNCRYVVENKFCPNCGQENTDTRKTFHHLFIHFFEDLTHYENAFWRTIKNLLFKPAALTKEYLSGKRLSYLAPVRLYIFISFITFLLIAIFPGEINSSEKTIEKKSTITTKNKSFQNTITKNDSVKKNQTGSNEEEEGVQDFGYNSVEQLDSIQTFQDFGYDSVEQLDSIQKNAPESKKLSDFSYWMNKKFQIVKENNTQSEIIEKFISSFTHNLPKVLFVFMPIFALSLWLFHNKKRWYYFDHGIFTLHYFSFLLLLFLLLFLINKGLTPFSESNLVSFIQIVINFIGIGWMIYYFYPAHHRFYGETRLISFIKSSLLFFINFVLIIIILSIFAIYTFINLH